ncbi:unnamed protein product [Penicillium pancosmium]
MPLKSFFHLPAQDYQGTSCAQTHKPAEVPSMKRCRRRLRRRNMISSRANRDSAAVQHWSPQSISYRNRSKISSEQHRENITTAQNLRHSIAGIRHAAVHRLAQDRDSLLQKNCTAIEFCLRIGDNYGAETLCRLFEFLQKTLPKSSMAQVQPQQAVPSHPRLPKH